MTTEEKFFNSFAPLAIATTIGTNLFPSVKLAMASIESDFGKSSLAKDSNNYFGVKAYTNPNNFEVSYHNDDTNGEPFRKYKNIYEGWKDQTYFLVEENPRYKDAIAEDTPEKQITAIMNSGYATAEYETWAIDRINKYNLKQYDKKKAMDNKIIVIGGIAILAFSVWFLFSFVKPVLQNS